MVEDWRRDYNHRRPHSALNYLTPGMYAAGCTKDGGRTADGEMISPPEDTAEVIPVSSVGAKDRIDQLIRLS